MELKTLEHDFAVDAKHLGQDLTRDLKAEIVHVNDPAQCGNIVRRHFDGIVIALYVFIFLFLATALLAFYLYTHH